MILAGDWRGQYNTIGSLSMAEFFKTTPKLLLHLILGEGSIGQLKFPAGVMLTGFAGVCFAAFRSRTGTPGRLRITKTGMVWCDCLIYCGGIMAIALNSVIAYAPRMFLPVLPHMIVLAVCGVTAALRNSPRLLRSAFVALLLLGYSAANFISRLSPQADARDEAEHALLGTDETGHSIRERLDQELKDREVIGATDGQAVGYVLKHPTLSLVSHNYSPVIWDEAGLHKELNRFGVGHLLIFRNAGLDSVVTESPFLVQLSNGLPPPWLRLIDFNQDVCVYQVTKAN
jgi:hypothetical protein